MSKNIWVICEGVSGGDLHTLQLLNKANQLAEQANSLVSIICVGRQAEDKVQVFNRYGCKNFIYCNCEESDHAIYANIIGAIVKEKTPDLIILPANDFGRPLAASLSSRFEAGLTADCIEIEHDSDGFVFSRAALNHTVVAKIKGINSNLQMCTVKQNVFTSFEVEIETNMQIEEFIYHGDGISFPLIETLSQKKRAVHNNLNHLAKVVFVVGRGIGSQENYQHLLKVAERLNVEVYGTRAAVEEGYIDKYRQVGQSGINICPDLYVGFGISGASQHIVGIKNAKVIIAVNKDEDAPIFDYSDYAIVDDVSAVLKELESMCESDI